MFYKFLWACFTYFLGWLSEVILWKETLWTRKTWTLEWVEFHYTCCYEVQPLWKEKEKGKHEKQNKRLRTANLREQHASFLYLLSVFLYLRFVWVLKRTPWFTTPRIVTELICCEINYTKRGLLCQRMISFALRSIWISTAVCSKEMLISTMEDIMEQNMFLDIVSFCF